MNSLNLRWLCCLLALLAGAGELRAAGLVKVPQLLEAQRLRPDALVMVTTNLTATNSSFIYASNFLASLMDFDGWVGGGSGETNYLGDAGTTNAFRFSVSYDKLGSTNRLRTISGGNGILGTNEGTNIAIAVDFTQVASLAGLSSNRALRMGSSANLTNTFKEYYFDTNVAHILSNLVAAAASGDVVTLGVGKFNTGIQTIRVPVGVTLRGQGMGRTIISGDVGVATNSIVQIMSTNTIEDLTIVANKPEYFQYPVGNNMIFGHPAATNAVLRRVQIFGETDCLLISQSNRVSVTLEGCDFRSAWDVCNLIDLDAGDGVPGVRATIIDSRLYSDSATATNPQALLDPKSQPLIVSGAVLDLINCIVTATNHKAITLSMQGFETNLVYVTDTVFRSAGTNGYGKQIDISTDSDVSVSRAVVSSARIQDGDINGSSGVTYLPLQTGSLRSSTIRSLDDVFASDGLFGRTGTFTNEVQAQTVNTTDLNATGGSVLEDVAIGGVFAFTTGTPGLGKVLADTDGSGTVGWQSASASGTNQPFVFSGGTLTLVSSQTTAHRHSTNASFAFTFSGTPNASSRAWYAVSNSHASATVYATNTGGIYDPTVGSNVTTFAVAPSSIRTLHFGYTDLSGWVLLSGLEKGIEFAAGPNISLGTNAGVVTFTGQITASTNGTPIGSGITNLQFVSPNTVVSNAGGGTVTIHVNASGGGPSTNAPPQALAINTGTGSTNITIDMLALGATNYVRATLTANAGIRVTNVVDGKELTLEIVQDSAGFRTIAASAVGGAPLRFGSDITGFALTTNGTYLDKIRLHGSGTNAQVVGMLRGYAP